MSGALIQPADRYVEAHYNKDGASVTGLTVTIDAWRRRAGAVAQIVTAQAATEVAGGFYQYVITSANLQAGDVVFGRFVTAGDVDEPDCAWRFEVEANVTAARSAKLDNILSLAEMWGTDITSWFGVGGSGAGTLALLYTMIDAALTALGLVGDSVAAVPTAADNADAAAEELVGDHSAVAGSFAEAIAAIATALSDAPTPTAVREALLARIVPGTYPAGSVGQRLGLLGAARAVVRSANASNGDFHSYIGDDHAVDYGNAFEVDDPGNWPDLTDVESVAFQLGSISLDGEVVNAGDSGNQKLRAEATAADLSDLVVGSHDAHVVITWTGGAEQTLHEGKVIRHSRG